MSRKLVIEKKTKYPHYQPVQFMWVGGKYESNEWTWVSTSTKFAVYTNWTDGTPGSGCVGTCTNQGLAVSVANNYQWKAKNPTEELPFICITKCRKHFKWFPKLQRCLKIKESGKYGEIALYVYSM